MRRVHPLKFWFAIGLCFGPTWLSASQALAQEAQSPARVLFAEGRELASAGNYTAACPKFEESLRLEPGVGTQFNLADCWEHVGRNASAQALFVGAAAAAKAAGQADREQVLRARAEALEPRLNKLVVETLDTDPRLTIKRDELPIERETWGKALALDPGSYVIQAKAPGKKPWSKTIKVEATAKIVTVEVPVLEAEAKPAIAPVAAVAVAPKPEPKPQPAPSPPQSDRQGSKINYGILTLGGVGLVSLGLGTYSALKYKSHNDDAEAICPSSTDCTRDDIAAHDKAVDKASTARTWAYVGFGVGTLAVGGAIALFILDSKDDSKQAVRALPLVGERGELGAALTGSF